MKIYFPDNVYSRLYANNLPENIRNRIAYLPSSAIPAELKKDAVSAGLITPMDILTAPEIFISSKTGISFEGSLSNSYIYFQPGQKDLNNLSLFGDVTSLEIILSKIFFKENYNSEIQIELLTDFSKAEEKNLLVSGDINFISLNYGNGLSFAEEMVDMLSLPFVNFIFASFSHVVLEDLNNAVSGISTKIYDAVEKGTTGEKLPPSAMDYLKDNISSLIYELETQDIDNIHQLIRLPYFYGIIQDMVDPKFV
jgi:hypothetical protein